jgi:hypothetical protein
MDIKLLHRRQRVQSGLEKQGNIGITGKAVIAEEDVALIKMRVQFGGNGDIGGVQRRRRRIDQKTGAGVCSQLPGTTLQPRALG